MLRPMRSRISALLTLLLVLGFGVLFLPLEAESSGIAEAPTTPATVGRGPDQTASLGRGDEDPWLKKSVLPYLFLTADSRVMGERRRMARALGLSRQQLEALTASAAQEFRDVMRIYRTSQEAILHASKTQGEVQQAVEAHNAQVNAILARTDTRVRQVLGRRYSTFRAWVRKWWGRELGTLMRLKQPRNKRLPGSPGKAYACYVFATQFYGYTPYEIALPDKYVKFANLGWPIPEPFREIYASPPYTVDIYRDGYWVRGVTVREVGPWNIDDNYWDTRPNANPRRFGSDIPLCWSEAEYAYYFGYNEGKDQFGRIVTVPTSADLTPALAADLGLKPLQNSFITVYYYDLP